MNERERRERTVTVADALVKQIIKTHLAESGPLSNESRRAYTKLAWRIFSPVVRAAVLQEATSNELRGSTDSPERMELDIRIAQKARRALEAAGRTLAMKISERFSAEDRRTAIFRSSLAHEKRVEDPAPREPHGDTE